MVDNVMPARIHGYGIKGRDDCVLLHIQSKNRIHSPFKKLPQHTDGHGEAERRNGHVKRRKRHGYPFVFVENIDNGEPDRRKQEAIDGVQDGIPERKCQIVFPNFSQNFRGENEHQNDDLHGIRDFHMELPLHKVRNGKQHQREDADIDVLIVFVDDLGNHGENDQQAENQIGRQKPFLSFDRFQIHMIAPKMFLFHGVPLLLSVRFRRGTHWSARSAPAEPT